MGARGRSWAPCREQAGPGETRRRPGSGAPHTRRIMKSPENTGRGGSWVALLGGAEPGHTGTGARGHQQTCSEQADGSRGPHPGRAGRSLPEPWKELRGHWRAGWGGRGSGRGPSAVQVEGGAHCLSGRPAYTPLELPYPPPRPGAQHPPHVFRSRGRATPTNNCLSPCGLREHWPAAGPGGEPLRRPRPPLTQPAPSQACSPPSCGTWPTSPTTAPSGSSWTGT